MSIINSENDSPLILIVDDDRFMRIHLRRAMEQEGYQVAEVSNGEEALVAYTRLHPDIVLLDALMPVMDGFTCCRQLQKLAQVDALLNGNLPQDNSASLTPVLMITGLEDHDSVNQAFAAGAIDYITKPINWAVLRQRVRRLLQRNQALKQLRQQTERALRSEERLRLALETAQMGTWDWDILAGKLVYCATTAANYGLAPITGKEVLSKRVGDLPKISPCPCVAMSLCQSQPTTYNHTLWEGSYDSLLKSVHPEDQELVIQAIGCALEEGTEYNIEFRVIWPDHTVHWLANKAQVHYDQTGRAVRMTGINLDITERKQAQEELQRQHWRSRLFAEVTLKIRQSLQIAEILQTTVTEVQQILKCDRVLIFQLGSHGCGKVVAEALNPDWQSVLGQHIQEDYFESEYLRRYSQGRVYTISDLEKAEIPPCLVEFMQKFNIQAKLAVPILLQQKLWGLLVAHQCASPRQWTTFETELLGQLAAQIAIALAQAQLLEQETHQRQELARSNAELQQFASIASHDLQEPLRKIQTFGNRIKSTCGEVLTHQGRDYLERMENAAQRMQTLIDDLLTLSRVTTKAQPFIPVNLTQVVQEVLLDLEVCIQKHQGDVEVGEMPTIEADPIQMRQLLQNLIVNALKFHRDEAPQVVKISSQPLESPENHPSGSSPLPTFCQIIVEDNGIGFDEKYLDRIFNVFQRLHSRHEYEGTGMGLAICRKIAERHGGSITGKSTLGKGAKFIVTLPLKQRRGEHTSEAPENNRDHSDG